MTTNDPVPLIFSDRTENPEQPASGKASSRILKAGILVVAAAAIAFALLSQGDPLALLANAKAFLVATLAPQDDTDRPAPIIQSADAQALPPTTSEAPTGDDTASKTAGQSQTEIAQPTGDVLLNQFQAWAAEEHARTQVHPMPPVQDAQIQPVQPLDAQAQPVQDAQTPLVQNARAQVRHVQQRRLVRPVQNTRVEVRRVQNVRARVVRNARARMRPEQNAPAQLRPAQQDRPAQQQERPAQDVQNAQSPWSWLVPGPARPQE